MKLDMYLSVVLNQHVTVNELNRNQIPLVARVISSTSRRARHHLRANNKSAMTVIKVASPDSHTQK